MAMNTKTANLIEEAASARQARDKRLVGVKDAIRRYQGGDLSGSGENGAPENVEFEFVSYLVPQLAFDCPRVSVSSSLIRKQDEALALEVGLNRWGRDTRIREPLMEGAFDFAFAWAVFVTSNEPRPELGEVEFEGGRRGVPNRPYTKRVPYDVAFRDPLSRSPYDMRFAGHDIVTDKDDLLREAEENKGAGWNVEAIRKMPTDADLEKIGRGRTNGQPSRNEVMYTQLWVADAEIDWDKYPGWTKQEQEACHGMLFFLAESLDSGNQTKDTEICKPQPFYGPRWGPYVFIGEYVVPNEPYFMSPMAPVRPSIRFYNEVNGVLISAIKNYKRLLLVNDASGDLVETIRSGGHDHVFDAVSYERGQAEGFEVGGATNQMIAHKGMLKDMVDRSLGMSDVQRGAVTGNASATENALASEASSARIAMAVKQWSDGVAMVYQTVGYYLWYDHEVDFPISMEEAMEMGRDPQEFIKLNANGEPEAVQPRFGGGTDDTDSFDSLDLEIQPWSMGRMSEGRAAQNILAMQNAVAVFGPLVPTMPWVSWDKVEKAMVKWTGIAEFRGLFNLGVAAEVAGSEALYRQAEFQQQDAPNTKGGGGAKGPQALPAQQGPPASPAQQPQSQVQKQQPKPLPGRTSGGSSGASAAQSVGAA